MKVIQFKQQEEKETDFEIGILEKLDGARVYVDCAIKFIESCNKEECSDISIYQWVEDIKRKLHNLYDDLSEIVEDQKFLLQRNPWQNSDT